MSLTINYEDNLLPEGNYEMVIKSACEDVTKGGTQYISIPMVVRNDIEQKFQNMYLWHQIWRAKSPTKTDQAFGGYLSAQLLRICQAAGIPKGTQFESLQDLLDALKGKPLNVTVYHDEYQNQTSAKLKYSNTTKFPDCKHVFKSVAQELADITEEDDLPFDL